ncbi:FISUMP domain-containing protein [uncultured Fibrobacter sp.]|uniref:FISUMP domain-containing protein n=1 Tax=uncultured Fibrobacter sp. TaxID=261512 RepID=UPI0026253BFC|nr:FISUMP domain-containing protein [uncultured Fibrobacter sp.]
MEEVSSSSDEISSSESSSSSSSMSRDLSDCLMYWGETECKACLELSSSSLQISLGEMIDERDGHVYKTMTIDGKATWMAENLNYAYLQPTSTLDSSSWCYENEPDSCAKYGRLYLWSAAMDSAGLFSPDAKGCGYYAERENWYECPASNVRGVCPEHWHVPSSSEFSVPLLLAKRYVPCGPYSYGIGPDKYEYFGNTITAPNDLLSVEWSNPYQQWSEEDRDEMGFNLLPAGIYYAGDDWFEYNYSGASLWFSDEKNGSMAKSISLPQLIPEGAYDPRTAYEKNWAFPLRCVKDEVEE